MDESGKMNKMRDFHDLVRSKKNKTIYCWLFNIGIEQEWMADHFQVKDLEEELVVQHMEEILFFMAEEGDILLLRKMPDVRVFDKMKEMGFAIPHILCPEKDDTSVTITELVLKDKRLIDKLKQYAERNTIYLIPYGVTVREECLARTCGMEMKGSPANVSKKANSKLYARKLMKRLHIPCPEGMICQSLEDVKDAYNKLCERFDKIVIKRPYGASGQGLFLVDSPKKLKRVTHILMRSCDRQETWIVEGWYEEKIDLNVQLYIHQDGGVEIFSVKKQLLQKTVYKGSFFPFVLPKKSMERYIEQVKKVGRELYLDGVRGVVGIDSVLTKDEMFPVVEINVRFTLSTYLSVLPFMFRERYFQSIYYRVLLRDEITYEKVQKKAGESGLLFDTVKKEGIIFYNYACMDKRVVGKIGRLFAVVVSKNQRELVRMQEQMERILKEV